MTTPEVRSLERDVASTSSRALTRWVPLFLIVAALLFRATSLAQPAGGDQGLYAYVGSAIARGEVPYRDAWDQKPPAIHYTYALMFGMWRNESVVAAADLAAAGGIALLLWRMAAQVTNWPGAGAGAALVFLVFANPALGRLGGVRVRSQCETFIAVAVAAALFLLARGARERDRVVPPRALLGVGLLLGVATAYKYNALIYAATAAAALIVWAPASSWKTRVRDLLRGVPWIAAGVAIPIAVMLAGFATAGALDAFYDATVLYNLQYSGSTYSGPTHFISYLASFPVTMARVDPLWFLGGLGSLVLLARARREPAGVVALAWIASACLTIAVNGSRNLPQYFVQATPALALAAGWTGAIVWAGLKWPGRIVAAVLLAFAIGRIGGLPKAVDYALHDVRYLIGRISRIEYLERFGGRPSDKYWAAAVTELGDYMAARTRQDEPVYVFGFSGAAYVHANRRSASRFFWSYPVIVGFKAREPGYGAAGVLDDLRRARPGVIALQRHDWDPDGPDSATFFMNQRALRDWLEREYRYSGELRYYALWQRIAR